jgi:hypothetical protein
MYGSARGWRGSSAGLLSKGKSQKSRRAKEQKSRSVEVQKGFKDSGVEWNAPDTEDSEEKGSRIQEQKSEVQKQRVRGG